MNTGDKKHPICIRVNDEMFDWMNSQAKEMGVKSLGEYIRILIRVGMVTAKDMSNTAEKVVNVLKEELQPTK